MDHPEPRSHPEDYGNVRELYTHIQDPAPNFKTTMDSNIHIPRLSGHYQAPWARRTKGTGGGSVPLKKTNDNALRENDASEDKQADTMRKELEEDGIVKSPTKMEKEGIVRTEISETVSRTLKKERHAPNNGAPEGVAVHRP